MLVCNRDEGATSCRFCLTDGPSIEAPCPVRPFLLSRQCHGPFFPLHRVVLCPISFASTRTGRYGLFWIVLLTAKFAFSYYLQVSS